jgi:hypothetical protein
MYKYPYFMKMFTTAHAKTINANRKALFYHFSFTVEVIEQEKENGS